MNLDSENPFSNLFRQLFPFIFSLLDDALIVGLSRLGCNLPCLEWLSSAVMTCTALYIAVQFWHYGIPKLVQVWRKFKQKPDIVKIPASWTPQCFSRTTVTMGHLVEYIGDVEDRSRVGCR